MSAWFPNASLIWTTNKIYNLKRNLPNLQSEYELIISPTHKRTEGRAPVWGSEFTSKDAALQGWSAKFLQG
jgi:hypothetical protein